MKILLYDILLHLSLIITLPYFLVKMVTVKKYREGLAERLGFLKKEKTERLRGKNAVWFHAVSVGETRAVMPLLRLFKQRRPDMKIVFSTVTKTGQAVAASEGAGLIDALLYFPLDLSWSVRRVAGLINPKVFVVVEKEVWPNFFRRMKRIGCPIIVVNGTISDRSAKRFVRFGFFFKEIFSLIDFFSARTDVDCEKALRAGVDKRRAAVTGNIKFDLKAPELQPRSLASLKGAVGADEKTRVIVAGSTHPGEEEIILDAFKELLKELKRARLIIAPRHPERFGQVEALVKKTGLACKRRSEGGADEADVVILDSMGELATVYSFSDVSIVGGSLVPGVGGHNLLEPALFAKPVLYGSHLTTYLDMADMLEEAGGGIRVEDGKDLFEKMKRLLVDAAMRSAAGKAARETMESNTGAMERTLAIIERNLPGRKGRP